MTIDSYLKLVGIWAIIVAIAFAFLAVVSFFKHKQLDGQSKAATVIVLIAFGWTIPGLLLAAFGLN